jgi:putative hydrolase of the HAD superfamily
MTERAIKVITFDLDNTLWDVEPVLLRAEQVQYQWLEEHRPRVTREFDSHGLRRLRMRTFELHPELAHHISELRRQALYDVQVHCGYSEELAREGAAIAFDAFLKVRHQVEPYERALEVLEELAERYTLGALSNGNADIFKVDIGEYFDFAFSAEQLGASKPLPDMFHASMRASGAASDEMIHVGDNPEHDVVGAQQVGMYTVWMNMLEQPWPGGNPADEEIRALEELPAAITRIDERARKPKRGR